MQDGVIDEDEQRDIDAAKAAIAKARTGVTPGWYQHEITK